MQVEAPKRRLSYLPKRFTGLTTISYVFEMRSQHAFKVLHKLLQNKFIVSIVQEINLRTEPLRKLL